MIKSMQKTLIAASVGAAFIVAAGAASAAGVGTTNLLFPYVSTGANAYSFVTVLTPSTVNKDNNNLHFAYGMKSVSAKNSDNCDHSDGTGTHTTNDVMQFEVRNRINLPAAFGDTTSTPYYYNGGTDKQGFLIVNTDNSVDTTRSNATIYGEAVVIDTANGMRLAYSSTNLNTDAGNDPDFTANNTGVAGGPEVAPIPAATTGFAADVDTHPVSWYAANTVTTGWFVAPLGLRSEMTPSAGGGVTASYNMFQSDYAQTGAYNANEKFQSGAAETSVKCFGVIQRKDILQDAAVVNTANGGWSNLVTTASNTKGTVPNKSLVYKLQSTGALGGTVATVSREANR